MKKIHFVAIIATFSAFAMGCGDAQPAKEAAPEPASAAPVVNSRFSPASDEYAELSERAMDLFAKMDFEAWAAMLSDTIVYMFPDGDQDTRTRLTGKQAVTDWWKKWRTTSGIESMTLSEFNHFPIEVTEQPKGGALKGIYDFSYFSNKLVYGKNTVSIRMNFVTHFNADKKIDRYVTYYDRSKIITAAGGNVLQK